MLIFNYCAQRVHARTANVSNTQKKFVPKHFTHLFKCS